MHQDNVISGHPCLLSFRRTPIADFPLVLVVGREPNEDIPATAACGSYDFRGASRCAFWNIAYGLLGSSGTPPRSTGQAKDQADHANASPLAFSDALPLTLRHSAKDKAAKRLAISDVAIEAHVQAVFSHRHLIDRVRVVILSGLAGPSFKRSVEHYEQMCADRDIALFHLPFFYPTNMPKIREQMTNELRDYLAEVLAAFDAFSARQSGLAA